VSNIGKDPQTIEFAAIRSMIDEPEKWQDLDFRPDEIVGWFDDLMNRRIAGHLLEDINGQSDPIMLNASIAAIRADEAVMPGIIARLGEIRATGPSEAQIQAFQDLQVRAQLNILEFGLRAIRKDPSHGLDYIRDIVKSGTRVLEQFDRTDKLEVLSGKQVASITIEAVEEAFNLMQESGTIDGLRSGVDTVDQNLGPIRPGQLVVIGGRPSAGKSALLYNYIHKATVERNEGALVVNMELPIEEQGARFASFGFQTGQSIETVLSNFHFDAERYQVKFGRAMQQLMHAPIHIVNDTSITIEQISQLTRRMVAQKKIKYLFLDYLTLTRPGFGERADAGFYTKVAQELKNIAKTLGIGVVAAAQLNRESEREKRPPKMSDLRESGGVEQAADKIMLLWARMAPKEQTDNPNHRFADREEWILDNGMVWVKCKIAKNRQGKKGIIMDLAFDGETGIFHPMREDWK
jgi:replicative DNA helicase